MNKIAKKVEEEALAYERGRMMRQDSEVELDAVYDEKAGKEVVMLMDYSEDRGSAEFVKVLCDTSDITEEEFDTICRDNHFCFVKDAEFKDEIEIDC